MYTGASTRAVTCFVRATEPVPSRDFPRTLDVPSGAILGADPLAQLSPPLAYARASPLDLLKEQHGPRWATSIIQTTQIDGANCMDRADRQKSIIAGVRWATRLVLVTRGCGVASICFKNNGETVVPWSSLRPRMTRRAWTTQKSFQMIANSSLSK